MRFKYVLFLFILQIFEPALASNKSAEYVGQESCVSCHKEEVSQWTGSHHDLAMQPANEDTVLGDFNNVSVTHYGITSFFY